MLLWLGLTSLSERRREGIYVVESRIGMVLWNKRPTGGCPSVVFITALVARERKTTARKPLTLQILCKLHWFSRPRLPGSRILHSLGKEFIRHGIMHPMRCTVHLVEILNCARQRERHYEASVKHIASFSFLMSNHSLQIKATYTAGHALNQLISDILYPIITLVKI